MWCWVQLLLLPSASPEEVWKTILKFSLPTSAVREMALILAVIVAHLTTLACPRGYRLCHTFYSVCFRLSTWCMLSASGMCHSGSKENCFNSKPRLTRLTRLAQQWYRITMQATKICIANKKFLCRFLRLYSSLTIPFFFTSLHYNMFAN